MFSDDYFMKMALMEAEEALTEDEIPIGAVIVLNNKVIARGHNHTQLLNDVTAHAEMEAITAAANHLGAKYLNDCTLYVTVEPCVMCAGAIAWAQLGTLVYGASDPKRGFTTLNSPILHPKTIVRSGVLGEECETIMKSFFEKKRITK
ncbi:MAG: nucleoside deaminase [Bacteroidales bacterium]|nr:nucleoside deaminase [Bacteroidales bacterium]MDD6582853.1 nucleoside deaminase [Bacteroidales bacterium]